MFTFAFLQAPEFHLVIQQGSNGEIYNLAIRGTNLGGSDGVDVWGLYAPHTMQTIAWFYIF